MLVVPSGRMPPLVTTSMPALPGPGALVWALALDGAELAGEKIARKRMLMYDSLTT